MTSQYISHAVYAGLVSPLHTHAVEEASYDHMQSLVL